MKLSKQRLRQILHEEMEKVLLEQDAPAQANTNGVDVMAQWSNIISNPGNWLQGLWQNFTNGYNQATGATNPATNTGTTATNPPAEAPNQETARFIYTFYFEPDVTAQQITSENLTERIRQAEIDSVINADNNIITANLRSTYANSGYPPNYNWSQYINQLKQAARQLITVSAPRIEENDDKTVASYTVQTILRSPLHLPNDSTENAERTAFRTFFANLPVTLRNKFIPNNQTPNNRNPDYQAAR